MSNLVMFFSNSTLLQEIRKKYLYMKMYFQGSFEQHLKVSWASRRKTGDSFVPCEWLAETYPVSIDNLVLMTEGDEINQKE